MKFIKVIKADNLSNNKEFAIRFSINTTPYISIFNSKLEANEAFWKLSEIENKYNRYAEYISEYNDVYPEYLKLIKDALKKENEHFILLPDDEANNYNIINPGYNIPHLFLKSGDSIN